MNQYFKRQLKTPTYFGSFGIHPSLKLLEMFCVKFHAAKHRLRTQNITSNFSETRFNTP